jgi:hypothetical protein
MRPLVPTLLTLGLAAPALAAKTETLTCAYVSTAGEKATVSVTVASADRSAVVVAVTSGKAELTLRKTGQSGKGLKVKRWDVTPRATEIDFAAGKGTGHVSFEKQDDVYRFEVLGAPDALRQAMKLKGRWFVLAIDPAKPDCALASVGVATMKADGTLSLQLRSWDHGMVAEALQVVKPDDAEYQNILEHLGGLKPGESKPIPEFPPKGEAR